MTSQPEQPLEPKTITLPLARFLDIVLSYHGETGLHGRVAVLDRETGVAIKSADAGEEITHVELPPDRLAVSEVYPIKIWRESYERRLKIAANRSKLEAAREEITTKILNDTVLGMFFDNETARKFADRIINNKDVTNAKRFGCDNLLEIW